MCSSYIKRWMFGFNFFLFIHNLVHCKLCDIYKVFIDINIVKNYVTITINFQMEVRLGMLGFYYKILIFCKICLWLESISKCEWAFLLCCEFGRFILHWLFLDPRVWCYKIKLICKTLFQFVCMHVFSHVHDFVNLDSVGHWFSSAWQIIQKTSVRGTWFYLMNKNNVVFLRSKECHFALFVFEGIGGTIYITIRVYVSIW